MAGGSRATDSFTFLALVFALHLGKLILWFFSKTLKVDTSNICWKKNSSKYQGNVNKGLTNQFHEFSLTFVENSEKSVTKKTENCLQIKVIFEALSIWSKL